MRILMISDVYFPRINGVSTSIKTFNSELIKLGHEIILLAPEYQAEDKAEEGLYRIPSRYVPLDPEDRMMKKASISGMKDELAKMDFDLVHIQTPFVAHYAGVELSNKLGIPRVETYHTHFEEYLYHYLPFMPKFSMRFLARWFNYKQCNDVDAVIVPSRAMFDILKGYRIDRPMEIIATGLDDDFFKPGNGEKFRQQHQIEADRPVLVHIGRMAHEKNVDFLLNTLVHIKKSMKDVLLILAGEGPAEAHLRKLSKTLGLQDNVLFVGYLDRNTALSDCYCAGDVFVFASRTETQGLVLLEAMAQGVPVVSIAELGTRDILDDAKGAIVAEECPTDFSNEVICLLKDQAKRQHMSEQAKLYASSWSARSNAIKVSNFYENVAQQYRLNVALFS